MRINIDYTNLAIGNTLYVEGEANLGLMDVAYISKDTIILESQSGTLVLDPKTGQTLNRPATLYPSRDAYNKVIKVEVLLQELRGRHDIDESALDALFCTLSAALAKLNEAHNGEPK